MKTIIGVVGEKGSGKETFVLHVKAYLEKKARSVSHTRSSDILAETLTAWDLPQTRHNLQHMAIVMDEGFGKGTLTHAVKKRIEKLPGEIVMFDGVRWHSDEQMIRSFTTHMLIYITADIKARYERTKERKEKVGESSASYEQFMNEERALTELDIPLIGQTADFKIENNATIEEFQQKVEDFCTTHLKV